jgi:hypothetical protein
MMQSIPRADLMSHKILGQPWAPVVFDPQWHQELAKLGSESGERVKR